MRECKLRSGASSQGALMQKRHKKGVEQGLVTTNLQPYLRYMTAVTEGQIKHSMKLIQHTVTSLL
jgi:hypothetical protein